MDIFVANEIDKRQKFDGTVQVDRNLVGLRYVDERKKMDATLCQLESTLNEFGVACYNGNVSTLTNLIKPLTERNDAFNINQLYQPLTYMSLLHCVIHGLWRKIQLSSSNAENSSDSDMNKNKYQNYHDCIVYLVNFDNYNPNWQNKYGFTALHDTLTLIPETHFDTTVKPLLDCKTLNPNTQNIFGWTPLHDCLQTIRLRSIKILLNMGAKMDMPNNSGYTQMQFAVTYQTQQIMGNEFLKR